MIKKWKNVFYITLSKWITLFIEGCLSWRKEGKIVFVKKLGWSYTYQTFGIL